MDPEHHLGIFFGDEAEDQPQEIRMEDEEVTTSDEYEEQAVEALGKGEPEAAGIYAQLALVATIREATFVIIEHFTDEEDDDDADDDKPDDDA